MPRRLPFVAIIALVAVACGGNTTPPTPSPGGTQGETITGRERIGWDQAAPSVSELSTYRYAIYLDGGRTEVADAGCATTAGSAGFACSGRLPAMSPGSHTLELAAFVVDGDTFESPRSAPLRVTVQSTTAGDEGLASWSSGPAGTTADGIPLAIERIADGLVDPTDLAIAPDGRVFVSERAGSLRTLDGPTGPRSWSRVDVEGGALLALALDPQFEHTHFVYAVYALPAGPSAGDLTYRLARFREIGGSLGERAVLVNEIAPGDGFATASLRATPDGRLLVAVGHQDGSSASSFGGKLLRVERDGTTPREQNGSPIVAERLEQPQGVAWDRARSSAWIVDRVAGAGMLSVVEIVPLARPRAGVSYRLPEPGLRSVAVYEGSLFPGFQHNVLIASDERRAILRLRFPEDVRSRQLTTERLLQDRVGPILLIAVAPDGTIYFSTADAVGRITDCRLVTSDCRSK